MFETRKSKIATLVIGGMLLVGSVGAAFADTATTTTTGTTSSGNSMAQEFLSDFATNLGVSQDKVTAALQATKQQMVQEAVQQGKITQDQATKILANKGFGLGFMGSGHKKGNFDITKNPTMLSNTAAALGLTVTQLQSDLQSGQTLQQIATAQGMTMQQLWQKMPRHQSHPMQPATTSTATN